MTVWWQKYIGIPFRDNGRSFSGCDCGGLAWLVYKTECGRELDCFSLPYRAKRVPEVDAILKRAYADWFTPVDSPGPFSLAVFGMACRGYDYHVGVFTDPLHVLHAKDGEHVKRQALAALPCAADFRGAYALR